jgi:hypothetical protein
MKKFTFHYDMIVLNAHTNDHVKLVFLLLHPLLPTSRAYATTIDLSIVAFPQCQNLTTTAP